MKYGRFLLLPVLSVGVVAGLGLSYGTSPAPLVAAAAAEQPATQGSPAAANPSEPAAATAAPADPPAAAAPASPPAEAAPPKEVAAPAPPAPRGPILTQAELGQLLAPIALYPDQLLSQILLASAHPIEIVEPARWVKDPAHRALKGAALTYALRNTHWDPSVMALVPFPHVLEMMSAQIAWVRKLGDAFAAQQADVMSEVQLLRRQAIASGHFKSGPQCRCIVEERDGFITVRPANAEVVYVPVYDSAAIYGAWLYPDYPPFLLPYPVGFRFAPGFYIGYGYGIDVAYYGALWGWGAFNWGGHSIVVDPVRYGAIAGWRTGFSGTTSATRVGGARSLTTTAGGSAARVRGGSTTVARAATSAHAARVGGRSAAGAAVIRTSGGRGHAAAGGGHGGGGGRHH